jgi:predicted ferric reductase
MAIRHKYRTLFLGDGQARSRDAHTDDSAAQVLSLMNCHPERPPMDCFGESLLEKATNRSREQNEIRNKTHGPERWKGETSYLRKDTIAKYIGKLIGPLCYIAGPPAMVASMRQKLRVANVSPDDIFTDEFTGY